MGRAARAWVVSVAFWVGTAALAWAPFVSAQHGPHEAERRGLDAWPHARMHDTPWNASCAATMLALRWAEGFETMPRPDWMPSTWHPIALRHVPSGELWACVDEAARSRLARMRQPRDARSHAGEPVTGGRGRRFRTLRSRDTQAAR